MPSETSFWAKHGSVIFLAGTILASLGALLASVFLKAKSELPFSWFYVLGTLLEHFAAIGVASFVAAILFSRRDIRDTIAGAITNLLLDGGAVLHLSSPSRSRLRRKMLLHELAPQVAQLDESLFQHLERVSDQALGQPHILNYTATTTLSDDPNNPGILRRFDRCNYTVTTRHLRDGRGNFDFRFRHDWSFLPESLDKPVTTLSVRIGDCHLTKDDLTWADGTNVILASLNRSVEVVDELEVVIAQDGICSAFDRTEIMYTSYPTRGFSMQLIYKDGVGFDFSWFKDQKDVPADFPARDQVTHMPTGITAHTNDWLLPGHGVSLFWFPTKVGDEVESGGALTKNPTPGAAE